MELHHLARHGVVSVADARAVGLEAYALRALAARGTILRLIRGWYAVRPPGAAQAPWEGRDPFEAARRRHRLQAVALLRSFDGRVCASHQSALLLHDVDLWRADLGTVHLCRTRDDHSRHRTGAVIHPATALPLTLTPDGLSTVDVAAAVVQVGLRPTGPARQPLPLESLVAADSALRQGLTSHAKLAAALAAHEGHPGVRGVSLLLPYADGRHESVGETRLAHAMRSMGFRFTPQVEYVIEGQLIRTDFELDDAPVVVEFDGMAKYGAGLANPSPEQLRAALVAEKLREDRLRSRGKQVVRFVWADLDSWELIRRRINDAVSAARLRRSA